MDQNSMAMDAHDGKDSVTPLASGPSATRPPSGTARHHRTLSRRHGRGSYAYSLSAYSDDGDSHSVASDDSDNFFEKHDLLKQCMYLDSTHLTFATKRNLQRRRTKRQKDKRTKHLSRRNGRRPSAAADAATGDVDQRINDLLTSEGSFLKFNLHMLLAVGGSVSFWKPIHATRRDIVQKKSMCHHKSKCCALYC